MFTRILLSILIFISLAIIVLLCRVDIVDSDGNLIEKKRAFFFSEKIEKNNTSISPPVQPKIIDTVIVLPSPPTLHGIITGSSVKLKDKCSFDFTVKLNTHLNQNTSVIIIGRAEADTTNWRFIRNGCFDIYKKKIAAGKAIKIVKKIGEDSYKIQFKEGDMITSTDISKTYLERMEPLHYKVRINDGQEGWVSAKYVSIQE
jgi:hypothetical protein